MPKPQTTRLLVRYASFPVEDSLGSAFYYSIFEPAHFVMEAGMNDGDENDMRAQPISPSPADEQAIIARINQGETQVFNLLVEK